MNRIEKTTEYCKNNSLFTLDDLLELIQVETDIIDLRDGQHNVDGWFGVSNEEGIIAYFGTQEEAFSYRLNYINRVLNG